MRRRSRKRRRRKRRSQTGSGQSRTSREPLKDAGREVPAGPGSAGSEHTGEDHAGLGGDLDQDQDPDRDWV